jgi:hypothetical protein
MTLLLKPVSALLAIDRLIVRDVRADIIVAVDPHGRRVVVWLSVQLVGVFQSRYLPQCAQP